MRDKKGFITVFILVILMASILIIGAFTELASGVAARSFSNAVIDLAGRSVLSEYDRNLKDCYGLFGINMKPEVAINRLGFYIKEGFSKKRGKMDLFDLSIVGLHVDMSSYALTNQAIIEGQIIDYMKQYVASGGMSIMDLLLKMQTSDYYSDSDDCEEARQKERTLVNEKVIHMLPTRLMSIEQANYLKKPGLDILTEKADKNALINLYILKKFQHKLKTYKSFDRFFANEIEYILFGKTGDKENKDLTKHYLLALRSGINMTHILSDPKKKEIIAIAAEIMVPGPGAMAAQALLTGTWAAAEASNDVLRLEKGGRVPLIKTSEDWVTDLESVINNIFQPEFQIDKDAKGLSYEGYLFLMLFFEDHEAKLVRLMDLIQLNLQGGYCEEFKMGDCYGGLDIDCKIDKRNGFFAISERRTGNFCSSHVY